MGEKQEKITVIKWVFPSLFLLIILIVLLINFSVSGQKKSAAEVDEKMIGLAEEYADEVSGQITRMTDVGVPMAALLSYYSEDDEADATHIAKTLVNNSAAYQIVIAGVDGKGITNSGVKVNISDESYYVGNECEKQIYQYVEKEEISSTAAIVSVIPIIKDENTTGVLYMYYPLRRVSELFYEFSLYTHSVMALSLEDGTIIALGGRDTSFIDSNTNIIELLKDSSANTRVKEVVRRMDVLNAGSIVASRDEQSKYIAYVPLKINKWYINVGINESYVSKQISLGWRDTRGIMISLIFILSAFVITLAAITAVMKIRFSQHSKTLANKADTDLLTDLYNKMATEREIKEYLYCKPEARAIMFVLDIDNFKKINDTRGHAFGDEVLKAIGVRLQTAFRVTDIVGRTGGDEFTVFLKDVLDDSVIEKEMRKLTNIFVDFNTGEYVKYSVTASIGCALCPDDANTFEELYKAADSALYTAKKRGKNQIARYERES